MCVDWILVTFLLFEARAVLFYCYLDRLRLYAACDELIEQLR